MNNEIRIIDELMKEGKISFSEATKCWNLVRKGHTATSAVCLIINRKNKKEQKKIMKRHSKERNVTMEQLTKKLNDEAKMVEQSICEDYLNIRDFSNYARMFLAYFNEDPMPKTDAMAHIDEKASARLMKAGDKEDLMEVCYDNTQGAEALFY